MHAAGKHPGLSCSACDAYGRVCALELIQNHARWILNARETEVADLELTVGIDEEVARLEITMENVCGMDVFETAQGLIDEGLEVGVGKRLLRADLERKADMSCAEMIK